MNTMKVIQVKLRVVMEICLTNLCRLFNQCAWYNRHGT